MREILDVVVFVLLLCCVPVLVLGGLIVSVVKLLRLSASKKDIPFPFTRIWYRTGLITGRGITVFVFSVVSIWLATISIELSTLSAIGLFFMISLVLIWLYAQLINIYLVIKKAGAREGLISSRVNYHFLREHDAIKQNLKLNLPKPLGFIIKTRVVLPQELGAELKVVGLEEDQIELIPERTRRGEHKLGPVIVEYTDLFGLLKIMLQHNSEDNLLVVPKVKPIQKLSWRVPTDKHGDEFSIKKIINTDELYDVKPYTRGDDVRRIHWKATAKTNELMLRKAELTFVSTGRLMVVIDNQIPRGTGVGNLARKTGSWDLLDRMVSVSASILDFAQRQKLPVKVFYFDKSKELVGVDAASETREQWLRKLAEISWIRGRSNSFKFNLDKQKLGSTGFFLLTSEVDTSRLRTMNNSIKTGGANFIYFPASSYLETKSDEGYEQPATKLGRWISRIFLSKTDYVERKSMYEYWKQRLVSRQSKLSENDLEKLRVKVEDARGYLETKFSDLKVISKDKDYIRILEGVTNYERNN